MAANGSLLRFTSRLFNSQLYRNNKLFYIGLRTFLSEAYQCTESWNRRLQSPVMQKIRVEEFYYDILKKFQSSGKASAIDVDMFVNAPVDSHIDELVHVTNRFRRSPSTVDALPSTSHAVIRNLLEQNETDTLMRLINDRLNYGLFPDYYLSNLMMDKFLKQSKYRDAVKVAIQMMLQEDFDHPIASHMALYSCYLYLRNLVPEPWDPQPQPKPEEPAEVVKVRVDYLREPFFDDHFDLTDPKHLVGKTLIGLARYFDKKSMDKSIVKTSQLTGLVLFQKYDKVAQLLDEILQSKVPLSREWVNYCKEQIVAVSELPEGFSEKFSSFVEQMDKQSLLADNDIVDNLKVLLETAVKEHEPKDIEVQHQTYAHWIKVREEELQKQVDEYIRQQRIAAVQAKKEELQKKEETLFFFENQTQWELLHEEKEKLREERDKKVKASKGKTKAQKQAEEEAYIPPEVQKRRAK